MASLSPWFGGRWDMDPVFVFDPFDFIAGGWPEERDTGLKRGDTRRDHAPTSVDWLETSDAHILYVELPGVGREAVKVQMEEGNVLEISGEKPTRAEEREGDVWRRTERSGGTFRRRFRLPENADIDTAESVLHDGVLTVTIAKKPEASKTERNVRAVEIMQRD